MPSDVVLAFAWGFAAGCLLSLAVTVITIRQIDRWRSENRRSRHGG
jgi:peptidoglycan biosynthesis protein MviN/MurJ (putative lipid II flippase)